MLLGILLKVKLFAGQNYLYQSIKEEYCKWKPQWEPVWIMPATHYRTLTRSRHPSKEKGGVRRKVTKGVSKSVVFLWVFSRTRHRTEPGSRDPGIREKRGRREQVFVAAPNNEQDIGPSRKNEEGRSTVASSKPDSVW